MEINIIRSNRKTLGLEIKDGQVTVRAPLRASRAQIDSFISEHRGWIEKHLEKYEAQEQQVREEGLLSAEEIRALASEAAKVIPERVRFYASLVGVTYGRITVRNQRTKWGSCSAKGNLNFNCLLMLAPPQVLDSVVVHELCHRKEMNHSDRFYREVYRVFPEYDRWRRWLRENGPALMMRMG
ncbi:MAG: M48 family metallopeptidase [Oscillospiraceae bacterium]|nr:M48 family metallopeptidase [Oscillospiraceae bacterium]